jgi:hypothetical protein
MLPLIYCYYQLSARNGVSPSSSSLRNEYTGCTIIRRLPTRFQRADSQPLTAILRSLFDGSITTPLRVCRALYAFGRVLDETPENLNVRQLLGGHRPSLDEDQRTVSIVGSECTTSNGYELLAPATASQVYHAAIVNGTTLDDLLAVFEVTDTPTAIRPKHSTDDLEKPSNYPRYRNSSIQTTPDSLTVPRKASSVLQDEKMVHDGNYGQLVKVMGEATTRVPQASNSYCCSISGNVENERPCENTSPHHSQCPTFARRQAQSRLPKKSQGAGVLSQSEIQKRDSSGPFISSFNLPPKRNKLRRPRVV